MRRLTYSVNVLVAIDENGEPHGATISSLISLSVEPEEEEILFVVRIKSRTHQILMRNPQFSFSLLSKNQKGVGIFFSNNRNTAESEKYLIESDFENQKVLFVKDSQANLICKYESEYILHHSVIILAKVLQTRTNGESEVLTYSQRKFN